MLAFVDVFDDSLILARTKMILTPLKLKNPWLIAVWPGVGNVAISAGYYLMAKLRMSYLADFSGDETPESTPAHVKDGMIQPLQQPANRLFVWHDPSETHDIVLFVGESHSQRGDVGFSRRLMNFAKKLGVERVFTFAAVATSQMLPAEETGVSGVINDKASLVDLEQMDIRPFNEGTIDGPIAVLLTVAAEMNVPGVGLLGEIPRVFLRIPCPRASLSILEKFKGIANLDLDTTELAEHCRTTDEKIDEILDRVQHAIDEDISQLVDGEMQIIKQNPLDADERRRIEKLFSEAERDRAKGYELKQELDRLDAFDAYEDRFLDLFGDSGTGET